MADIDTGNAGRGSGTGFRGSNAETVTGSDVAAERQALENAKDYTLRDQASGTEGAAMGNMHFGTPGMQEMPEGEGLTIGAPVPGSSIIVPDAAIEFGDAQRFFQASPEFGGGQPIDQNSGFQFGIAPLTLDAGATNATPGTSVPNMLTGAIFNPETNDFGAGARSNGTGEQQAEEGETSATSGQSAANAEEAAAEPAPTAAAQPQANPVQSDEPGDASVLTVNTSQLAENADGGIVVGSLTIEGDAAGYSFSLEGEGADYFEISGNQIVVRPDVDIDFETNPVIDFVVVATGPDGAVLRNPASVDVTDLNEGPTAIAWNKTDVDENATGGTLVGTLTTTDTDAGETFTYTLSGDSAGLFEVVGDEIRVRAGADLDFEVDPTHQLTVTVTDSGGNTFERGVTVTLGNVDEFDVSPVTDGDSAANTLAEDAVAGVSVGIRATASDADGPDTVSFTVDDARFTVDADGTVRVANGASFDAETESSIDIVVTATSTDGSTSQETFSLNVSDIDEADVGAITDSDNSANSFAENASEGTTVGVTAAASDADVSDSVSFSVDDNRFTVDANGVVKVASGASFDAETEGSIDIVVTATSTDGSTSQETFSLNVSDIDEADIGAVTDTDNSANSLAENASEGTTVGVTASASDADVSDTVSYSVDDNRFTVDANGVVEVASGASFDAETEGSIDIVVTATSTDGSTSQETFSLNVSDVDEADVGAVTDTDNSANSLAENASEGTTVGVTATATDADVSDSVSYSVDDNRFTVDANGVVKVASGASFDAETEGSIDIIVTATSTDGSTSQETFSLNVSDIDEADIGTVTDTDNSANSLAENASEGMTVGVTASASDADVSDTVSYSVDDNRFTVDANGVVKVASGASFDAETEGSIDIVVTATSTDGSTSQETFSLNVSDIDEADVGAVTDTDNTANSLAENATEGTTVGVTASANDADVSDTVTYSVDDNRFTVDANGVVKVTSGASFDAETEGSIDIVVTATSTDGSTSQETFSLNVSDIDEADVGAVTDSDNSANSLAENASEGATVGVTASASDADVSDTVTYSVDDNRFTVDANGVVKVANGASFDAETEGSIDIVVTATSTDGSTSQETFSLNVSDIDEADVGAVTDTDNSANSLAENALEGTTVGVTATASDADVSDSVSYSVDDNRFTVDANGVVKVASGASFDAETEGSIDIVVTATSTDGSTSQETFSLNVSDIDEADVGAVTDSDNNANSLAENATEGATIGVTASASDADVSDTVSYSVDDNRFTVDANGVVKVASGASFDAETEGSIDIVVTATSTDGSTSQETFSLNVSDINDADVSAVTDTDNSANELAENAGAGTTVGVTASASDSDVSDSVSYSVDDNRFTVDANGVVKVANGASFDAETEGSIDIVVTATSTDGSTSQETFSLNVSDIDESDVGAVTDADNSANSLAENATEGTSVGVTASASDADVSDSVSYSVDDNRFTVDANGVVKVASGASFDAETEGSIDIVVTATSTDGSTSQETFSLNVSDIDEADVGAVTDTDNSANSIAENASGGTTIGVTAAASDDDASDTVAYSVDDNRFTVDANGVVKVAGGASFDAETEGSIDIVVTATSTDGSTSQETFSVNVTDVDEFDVGAVSDTDNAVNTLAENVSAGTAVGVTASASDADITDNVSYSVDDNRFTVDANGVVKVASGASFDAETEGSIDIVVTATSTDGSTSQETFSLNVSDIDEADVGAVTDTDNSANSLAENASQGTTVGVTAAASDADVSDSVSYSVDDNRFTVDVNGVVKVASGASFDAETEGSIDIVVTATSTDGSTSQETFSLNVSDIDETDVGAVTDSDNSANSLAEDASEGVTVGVTASASDADVSDSVSYSVDDNRFTVDANGVVKVASGASFDAETEGSIDIVVTATSTDGSTSQETFSLNVSDVDEADVGAVTDSDNSANSLAENAFEGTTVGVTASASDADVSDSVSYSVDDNRFTVDANGVVKVASGASFDAETEGSIDIVVTATSTDGSTSQETFSLNVSDIDESDVGAVTDSDNSANSLAEDASEGAIVGVTASASDADVSDSVSYSIDDNRFTVDANGVVKVASGASFDAETEGSIDIVVTATSTDGSTSLETFSLNVSDVDEADVGAVTDSDNSANSLAENASEGTTVGVTASASDADVSDSVSYSVDDNRFTVDANGVVKVASGASFDAETEGSIDIVVTATSTDGSTSQETFSLNVSDIDEADVGAVTDSDNSTNNLAENASEGTTVGVTATASDADVSDSVSYSVDDNRFTVDANGVVKVASGASFDAETEGSIDIVVTATSTDGSTSQETFSLNVSDIDEADVGAVTDTDDSANSLAENALEGTTVGVTAAASDADVSDTVSYSVDDNRFTVDANGVVKVASGASFDAETEGSIDIVVTATSTDGSTSQETFSLNVSDVDESDVGAVTDADNSANSLAENASEGTTVGVTAAASDADVSDSVSYSVDDNRFTVDANGVVKVASGASFDAETEGSIDIVVTATSTDGSTSQETFSLNVSDIDEADIGAVTDTDNSANSLAENASEGTTVGVTASASDADVSDTVTYSVDDNRFTVDANGVVKVASGASFDAETEGSIDIVVTATSTDGSTSQETFSLNVSDIDEADVGAVTDSDNSANTLAENASQGTTVGVTAAASDADVSDSVSYSVDDNRFTVDANGVVKVASGASFDAETEGSIDIVVTATSTDGSTSQETFSLNVSDIDEADVGAVTDTDNSANSLAENASEGTTVGVTAAASDADVSDSVSYSVDDNRFTVDANGVVKVASGASFDAETEGSIDIVVTATSTDGSTSQETFSLNVSDIDEADVSAVTDTDNSANSLAENASEGATVGVTASASDTDVSDTVTYSVDDNRFTVDANGVVKVASGASFDAETEGTIDIVVTATSTDGSTSQEIFSLNVSDIDEADVGAVTDTDNSANSLAENASEGATVGVTASASDTDVSDTVTYSVDDNRFTVDANGVVKVASGASFDAETEGSIDIVVTATSTDGSTSQETFSLNVSDIDEADVGAVTDTDNSANSLAENASEGTTVGVTASASDADVSDTVTYSVDDNRFTVDANGVVKVASGASFDAETEGSIDIVVTATSTDGSTSQETFSLNVSDIDEADVGAVTDTDNSANSLAENASEGTTVGVTASASDADVSDTVSYSVDDNRFTVDANGVVKVASGASFDAETEGSIDIVVTATSTDGSTSQETFSLNVSDVDEADVGAVTDTDNSANGIAENASVGTAVGVTAAASDADITDTVSYSVNDNRFTVDANGVVKVASGASFDAETEGSIDIVVTATSTDGSTSQETFSINVSDIDEFDVGAVTDTDNTANSFAENATAGTVIGVTASASDADASDTVTYSVDDNRFTVDANGVVKVASGASFDHETEGSIDIVVTATSSDGSTSQETFTTSVADINEAPTALTITPTQSLGPNLIVNGSFEADDVATGSSNNATSITGWKASSGSVQLQEAWGGHTASDGSQYLETDAETGVDAVYQDVQTEAGRTYDLTFDAADRSGSSTNVFEVYWNGNLVQQFDPASTSWEEFTVSVTGTGGTDRLEFRELESGNDMFGALIDNVSLKANYGVDSVEVMENSAVGTVVASLAATDEDSGETLTYTLSGGGAALFEVVGNEIRVKAGADVDFESAASHDVTVTVTDSGGNTYDQALTINVANLVDGDTLTGTDLTAGGSGTITASNFTDTDSGFTVTARNVSGGSLTAASVGNVSSSGSLIGASGSVSDTDNGMSSQLAYDKASGISEQLIVDFDNGIDSASFNFENLYTSSHGEVGHWAVYNDGVLVAEGDFSETSPGSGSGTVSIDPATNFNQLVLTGNLQTDGTDGSDFQISSVSYNEAATGGNDSVTGGAEEDLISGLSGEDSLVGGGGNDTIIGGGGDDTIVGGTGNDSLSGDGDAPTYDEYVATLGAVVHYQFDGDGASVVDSSGNGHAGIYQNGADDTGTGFNGESGNTSLALDGTNDYVEIPADTDFQLTEGVVSLWFNADEIASSPTLFSRDSNGNDGGGHLTSWINSDGSVTVRLQSDSQSYSISSSAGSVTAGEWSQVSFSWGDDGMKLYVDGQLAASNSGYTGGLGGNNEPWTIGADQMSSSDGTADNLAYFLDGEVDEFVVVGNQLDDGAVNDLFVAGEQGPSALSQYSDGDDSISGGAGNDTIVGSGGSDTIDGGDGTDMLSFAGAEEGVTVAFQDTDGSGIGGTNTNTSAGGLAGDAAGDSYSNIEQFQGSDHADRVYGGSSEMSFDLGAGNDVFDTGSSAVNDTVDGGAGNDTVWAGDGADNISGGSGDDALYGEAGNDSISGGTGSDTIYGGDGNDTLSGGTGNDVLSGGSGDDLFIFDTGDGVDSAQGGAAGGWTDTIQLGDGAGSIGDIGTDWTLQLDSGSISAQDGDSIDLSEDASGTITLDDGSQLHFQEIERIVF